MEEQLKPNDESRKVFYSFIACSGFYPDDDIQRESDEKARKRNGVYHGKTFKKEDDIVKLMFVIEDEKTGEVHEIAPTNVTFKK